MNYNLKIPIILASLLLGGITATLSAQQYLEVTGRKSNIRSSPTTRSSIVTRAQRGDIFELKGESGDWYHIRLFSGELRYLHKRLAQEISYNPEVPEDSSQRREIFTTLQEVDRRVEREAEKKHPTDKALKKNIAYAHILEDRYKLKVIRQFGIQAPLYRRLAIEGNQKGW